MILVDTDVLIDALNNREPSRSRVEEALASGTLVISAISEFELLAGVTTRSDQNQIVALLASATLLPFNEDAAVAAATLSRALRAAGATVSTTDLFIGATAFAADLPVLTRNRRDFSRIPGLEVVSP